MLAPSSPAAGVIGPGLRPFPECRRAIGHFGGCCGNCKWRDHAARCSARDDNNVVLSDDDDDDDNNELAVVPVGSAGNPITL